MKLSVVTAVGAVLVGVCPVSIIAQTDKAVAVLADAHKAIGAKALEDLKAVSVDAAVRRDVGQMQLDSELELLLAFPDKYARSETITRGAASSTSTTGFNGDTPIQRFNAPPGGGVMIFRMGGPGSLGAKPGDATPEQTDEMRKAAVRSSEADVSRLMLGWFAMPYPSLQVTYTYAGEAVSPDGKAEVIDVKGMDGFAARLFVDAQSHLPLMVTYKAPKPRIITMSTRGGPRGGGKSPEEAQKQAQQAADQPPEIVDYTIYVDDWRPVDGVKFPYAIRRAMSGTTTEDWTVKQVRINPTIDPKAFAGAGS